MLENFKRKVSSQPTFKMHTRVRTQRSPDASSHRDADFAARATCPRASPVSHERCGQSRCPSKARTTRCCAVVSYRQRKPGENPRTFPRVPGGGGGNAASPPVASGDHGAWALVAAWWGRRPPLRGRTDVASAHTSCHQVKLMEPILSKDELTCHQCRDAVDRWG